MAKSAKSKTKIDYSKQLEALGELGRALTSDNYLQDILALGVNLLSKVLKIKLSSLMIVDESKQELSIKATHSKSEEYLNKRPLKIGEGIAGRVVLEKKPISIYNVHEEPQFFYKDIALKEGLKSMLSVPLVVRNKSIGVLNCYTAKAHKFTKSEIDIVTLVANQLAIVIDNTELMIKTKLIEEELESRKIVERAKGILMKEENLTEDEAYKKIRKYSMDKRRSMKEISHAIITASELRK